MASHGMSNVPLDIESAPRYGAAEERQPPWRARSIQWREVFKRQDYANLILTAFMVIAVAVVSAVATPRMNVYYVYDAAISYPGTNSDFSATIPGWVAVLVPLLMLAITVVVGELVYSRRQHKSITDAVATVLHFLLDGVQSFVFGLVWTVITKFVAGGLRPDFLSRCRPANAALGSPATLQYGEHPDDAYPCTNPNNGLVLDGYKAFPSGHASTSFNLTTYASAYLIWCWHMRRPWEPRGLTFRREFVADVGNVLAKLWSLCMLSFAWGVAVSRALDNQHDFADVLGGAFVGCLVALVYFLRAAPRYKRVLSPAVEGEEDGGQSGLLHTASAHPPASYLAAGGAAPGGKH